MKVFNINDSYFKYQKCLSGITYQFVNQLDNIYEKNLMVGTNYCIYCMYNEFDIINNFMVNLYQVDVCSTSNLDLTKRYYDIDGAYLRTGHRVLLVNQTDPVENDIYNVDSRGFLILSDELAETGKTWRYKAYVKLGNNKGKQFHLKNSGNRFPIKGERKFFLDGHGYIIKNSFNYDLFGTDSIIPKIVFTDYELARISVNKNYELYNKIEIPSISNGGSFDIRYHENHYLIRIDNDTNKFIYSGNTSGTTIYSYNNFPTDGFGHQIRVEVSSTFLSNANVNDYIKIELSGTTNLIMKTFIKEIGSTYIVISDTIPDNILNNIYDDVITYNSIYTVTNLMYSEAGTINQVAQESYYAKYFYIDESDYLVDYICAKENPFNLYFDYDGLSFEIFSNNGTIYGNITGSILEGAMVESDNGDFTYSDENGDYELNTLSGPRTIYVTYPSYIPITSGITILEDISQEVNFHMTHYTGYTIVNVINSINLAPVDNVAVTATGLATYNGMTDPFGGCMINSMLSGEYTFTVNKIGYYTQSLTGQTVPEDGVLIINIYIVVVPTVPILTTEPLTSITSTGATSGGDVTSDGWAPPVTSRGLVWSTYPYPTYSFYTGRSIDGSGTGTFVSIMTGLTIATLYYIRAFAINSVGIGYGDQVTGNTSLELPTLTTIEITNRTINSADTGGDIISNGGALITARGVCYSLSPNPTIGDDIISNGTGSGSFISNLTGLTYDQTYYVRSYATNLLGTAYGNELNFNTTTTPTLTTDILSDITSTGATSGGDITDDGGENVTERGVCWNTTGSPTISDPKTSDGTGTGTFVSSMTSLLSGNLYYVRAYATNVNGTSYGNEVSDTTLATAPEINTTALSNITYQSVTTGGDVINDGGDPVTERGVCYSTSPIPTTSDPKTSDGTGEGIFISSVSSLTFNTDYYFRSYATNGIGTSYGNEVSGRTLGSVPILTTSSLSNIAGVTATGGGNVTSDGNIPVTARGVCWNTTGSPTTSDPKTTNGTGTGIFTSNLTGLITGTTYHVRAYATNLAGTSYGNEVSGTTIGSAVVVTNTVTNVTQFTANVGGNVISDGDGTISSRGISWTGLTSAPPYPNYPTLINGNINDVGTGIGSYTINMTSLNQGRTYQVRAFAMNEAGTSYGDLSGFTTQSAPVIVTGTIQNITSTTAECNGNGMYYDGGSTITSFGVCWALYPTPSILDSTAPGRWVSSSVFRCDGTAPSQKITGLTPNTTYYVRAFATNSIGTGYGYDSTRSFTTLP